MGKSMSLAIAMVLLGFCSMAYAIDLNGKTGNQTPAIAVKNTEGEDLGTVKDFLMSLSGNVSLVIISVGEKGEKEIAVPVTVLLYDAENRVIILQMGKEEIAAAPEFNLKGIYGFFGVAPSWAEEQPVESDAE